MTLDGIAAVQARMAELQALVAPRTASTTTTGTTATAAVDDEFETLLAQLTGSSTPAATGGKDAQSFIAAAQKYVGVPYVWGGESLDEGGLDCSGLVIRALADIGITDFPRVARDQQKMGEPVASLAQALPGDLVVFGGGTHIGIYLGDGKMIDAPKPGATVTIRDVYTTPTAIRRILPQAEATTATLTSALQGASATAANQRAVLELLTSMTGGTSGTAGTRGSSSVATLAAALGVAS